MSVKRSIQMGVNRNARAEVHRSDWYTQQAADRLRPLDWSSELGIRRKDINVFRSAATAFNHLILVRASNPESLNYIGRRMYLPKPIDCKSKTAKANVYLQMIGLEIQAKGLVVDPTLLGSSVYSGDATEAMEEWESGSHCYR